MIPAHLAFGTGGLLEIFLHTSYQVGFDMKSFKCGDHAQNKTHAQLGQKIFGLSNNKLNPAKQVLPVREGTTTRCSADQKY